MLEKGFIYNKQEIINEYNLITAHEYALIPFEVRMAHCDKIYGKNVRKAKETNMVITMNGYLPQYYSEYFKANGCKAENYDLAIEEIEITSLEDKTYEVSEDAKNKLAYYLNTVINAKLKVFESCYRRYIQKQFESFENGESVELNNFRALYTLNRLKSEPINEFNLDLTDEELEIIIEAELVFVLEDIRNGKSFDIPKNLPLEYKNYLTKYKENCKVLTLN